MGTNSVIRCGRIGRAWKLGSMEASKRRVWIGELILGESAKDILGKSEAGDLNDSVEER